MYQHILVPLDDSPTFGAALPLVRALADAMHAETTLLHVVPDWEGNGRKAAPEKPALERIAQELGAGERTVATRRRYGDPADQILEEVTQHGHDLVVMATRGRSGPARVFLGSVAEEIVKHCSVPVVLLRAGGKRVTKIKHLLVPVDGSPGGSLALGAAIELARATGAAISLLEVVPPIPLWVYAQDGAYGFASSIDPGWDEEARRAAQDYVDRLATRLGEAGITAKGHAILGPVGSTIVDFAAEHDVDMLVMSTHGYTGPARAVLGSVADEMVRTAKLPVLLVRRDAERQPATDGPKVAEVPTVEPEVVP